MWRTWGLVEKQRESMVALPGLIRGEKRKGGGRRAKSAG